MAPATLVLWYGTVGLMDESGNITNIDTCYNPKHQHSPRYQPSPNRGFALPYEAQERFDLEEDERVRTIKAKEKKLAPRKGWDSASFRSPKPWEGAR